MAAMLLGMGLLAVTAGAQVMALTFDDLPTTGDLPAGQARAIIARNLLMTLKAEHMPPVYGMVNGDKVAADRGTLGILQEWRAAGQPLGSHTWSHMDLNEHTAEEFEGDIEKNEALLQRLMPSDDWRWFRYPFLWEGDTLPKRRAVRTYLEAHHYRIAQVTMDFEDYLWNEPYARCVAKKDERGIAWLETSYLRTAAQYAAVYRASARMAYGHEIPYVLLLHIGAFDAHMLPRLISLYRSEGFTFTTLQRQRRIQRMPRTRTLH